MEKVVLPRKSMFTIENFLNANLVLAQIENEAFFLETMIFLLPEDSVFVMLTVLYCRK